MIIFYCPKCGGTRWKTEEKEKLWQCRKCGFVGSGVVDPPKIVKAIKEANEKIDKAEQKARLSWWKRLLSFILHFFKHD